MFKNLAATDLVAARSPTSRRRLCNHAGTRSGTLMRALRLVDIVSRGEVAKRLQRTSERPRIRKLSGQVYPAELDIKDITESNPFASYLGILLLIGRNGQHHTSIYDKRDLISTSQTFCSSVVIFHLFQAYGVLSLSLFDIFRFAPRISVWFRGPYDFSVIT